MEDLEWKKNNAIEGVGLSFMPSFFKLWIIKIQKHKKHG